jgi:hypothetical protein
MDGLQSLLIVAVLYFGQKLWRYFTSKESTQPDVPKRVWSPEIEMITEEPIEVAYRPDKVQPPPAIHHAPSLLPIGEEQGAWQGKINNNLIVNGVIFAEILQPPRAYRPFRGRLK